MSSSDNNNTPPPSASSSSSGSQQEEKQRITQEAIQNVAKYLPNEDKKRAEQEITKDRKFWNNQPVPKIRKFSIFKTLIVVFIEFQPLIIIFTI